MGLDCIMWVVGSVVVVHGAMLFGLGLGCGLVMLVHVILIQSFFPTGK